CAWSAMTVFSFHPAKNLTTGEGGMVMTNSDDLYHQLKRFRNNGIERDPQYLQGEAAPWYYEVMDLTGNFNFTEMQAALGLSQLNRLDKFVVQRQALMKRYKDLFAGLEGVRLFTPHENLNVAYHLCVAQIDFEGYKTSRTEVMERLKERGIGTQMHYIPLYRHPFFTRNSGDISEYFPEMEGYYKEALSLPLFYDMTDADVDRVVNSVREILIHAQGSTPVRNWK
ncbi:MAG: DegT/DnrJ/EryC1/StrS family aminotransferase, partial [Parachlamydiaceae bacterium]|nr:DegT/DnrJ/EryC1/StrS family aminotransferase [Parachlamydiaceae bacterium]